MADDLDKRIKQIADMFGVTDTQSLKNIVENLSASQEPSPGSGDTQQEQSSSHNAGSNYYSPANYNRGNNAADFLSKASEMINMFNNFDDSRVRLLNSVQPFLRPQRQERLVSAVQLLKIVSIISNLSPNNRNTGVNT
ncbi:MAG: hypothetical protein GX184_06465 [Clostridiaceae bacterium]|nr:hypothetical protein [Clostridiaceae bacterium]